LNYMTENDFKDNGKMAHLDSTIHVPISRSPPPHPYHDLFVKPQDGQYIEWGGFERK